MKSGRLAEEAECGSATTPGRVVKKKLPWSPALDRPVTRSAIARVLFAGFGLVIILLLAAGLLALRNVNLIRETATELLEEQQRTSELLDEVQKEQRAINAIYNTFAREPDEFDRETLLTQLETSDRDLEKIVAAASGEPELPLWERLYESANHFSAEARRLLEKSGSRLGPSRRLLEDHQQVLTLVDRLVEIQSARSIHLKELLEDTSARLFRESSVLLGGGLLLALLCAVWTIRMTNKLIHQMEWQTGELSRVSWHLLENQETTARRFSHELHDELGQSLTAVKANLVSLAAHANGARDRLDDCLHLVDEAIGNVRELSQLLRPVILDDFGLNAGLKWLCDRFSQRTGVDAVFDSTLNERLADEMETHLFRIAQEALTNVARHSQASQVEMLLGRDGERVALTIRDNGKGLDPQFVGQPPREGDRRGMGMVGMRARARSAGGELKIDTAPGRGLTIVATIPFRGRID